MNQLQKQKLFERAVELLYQKTQALREAYHVVIHRNQTIKDTLPKENDDNKIAQQKLLEYGIARERELDALIPSPYFTHCKVTFDGIAEDMYFGKFSFSEEQIYSWITPASSLRFESPGNVSYTRPDGLQKKGVLIQKDQYMITDGKIVFLATESIDQERELVYQEYFSNQKKDFLLPEIVARMEKAQDTVIRANHRGPLVISGPAGSGKTTLALHRVAYLVQSPDVSDMFPPRSIIVFVQDDGTRNYFSHLLPQLGIAGVQITTFASWAFDVLGIEEYEYVYRYGSNELEKDIYEFQKYEVLQDIRSYSWQTDIETTLIRAYIGKVDQQMLTTQLSERFLDRFDLTVLLSAYKKTHGQLTMMQEYLVAKKNNSAERKRGRFRVSYPLMIFDEFQNYLPEQIRLAKSTVDEELNAVMYIGDMAQQTQFGTIQDWQQVGESIPADRKVNLDKVYRNTRQILEYIKSLGYHVAIDEHVRAGKDVREIAIASVQEQVAYVIQHIDGREGTVGILGLYEDILVPFQFLQDDTGHVHVMTVHEAQGVEFDMVCLVGVDKDMFVSSYAETYEKYTKEKHQVQRDLIYVALTRAMNELIVIGRTLLSNELRGI